MITTWTWTFRSAKVVDENGLTDVIKTIGYSLLGTRDGVTHEIGGETGVGAPDVETFIPFSALTEEETIQIVSSAVNVDALKTQIDAWFDVTEKTLPFAVNNPLNR